MTFQTNTFPLKAPGLLPPIKQLNRQCLHVDEQKWAHTSKRRNLLVRLFYKSTSHHFDSLRTMSKEEPLAVAQTDIENSLGIKEQISLKAT